MRAPIVAGNWKMNNNHNDTQTLLNTLKKKIKNPKGRVLVAPSFTNLSFTKQTLKGSPIEVAAQNMHFAEKGAFTGEVSSDMLLSIDVKTVILGHSERRSYFMEDDNILTKKVNHALNKGMEIIFCFGEQLKERKENKHFEIIGSQIKNVLFHLPKTAWSQIILAYEPVWAIGTGETATASQAQEMHAYIRKTIADNYNYDLSESVSILYGGSVKADNAKEIFSKKDVDGGLIGGAALDAESFENIVSAL